MLNETIFYLIAPCDRPPYGRVAYHLWGRKRMLIQTATVARLTTPNGQNFP
jgi:hypothetical protein